MSHHLIKSKIFLTFLGMVAVLSACTAISDTSESKSTAAISSSNSGTTSPVNPSPLAQSSQRLNQSNSDIQVNRNTYTPIALETIANPDALRGNDPKAIALSAFGTIESEGGTREVTVDYPQGNRAIVTIIQTDVADDSVGAIKRRVELQQKQTSQQNQQWEVIWAGFQVKCQPGRGHQDWSTELCL
ncbi:MAG TPA: hypothetical protein V6D33_11050 [Cyanophyceae cyanobacterium]